MVAGLVFGRRCELSFSTDSLLSTIISRYQHVSAASAPASATYVLPLPFEEDEIQRS
jgi:hypothetical protein